ncbi:uncharacterized protein LOC62_04G006253 [Vanrija pseudolonga]|uniref:Protein ZIP4 homolog n=1 Tax=Vanrija pseudolonga TaxID=143232 RepID=A0AAF1BJH8_9TREE|nr:hypothetical protein LOC62_04G006253 [Vanrija pseudolonga]
MAHLLTRPSEALQGFYQVASQVAVPTTPHTSPDDRAQLSASIHTLALAVDGLPRRPNRRRGGGDEDLKHSDWLDEEAHASGIRIWNFAFSADYKMANSPEAAKEDLLVVAQIKYVAFKLIDAATSPGVLGPFLSRLLMLASKAASSLSPIDTDGILGGSNLLTIGQRVFAVGETLRKGASQEAGTWFPLGLEVVERAKTMGPLLGLEELQMALLRSATRVELLRPLDASNLERVGKMLSDLVAVTNTLDPRNVHDVKILQLQMLQQQQAKEEDVRAGENQDALSAIIEAVKLTEETVVDPDLQRFARQELLNKGLEVNAGATHISRIIVGILIGVRKLEKDKQTALRVAKQALDRISTAEVELDGKASAAACQTVRYHTLQGLADLQIIWGFGESSAKASNFLHAAEWYCHERRLTVEDALGCHKALMPWGRDNASKCRRKAALCCINAGDFVAAQAHLDQSPATEASTHYLGFLIAAQQGRELAAVSAISAILNCNDLDSKQLLLMVQVSVEKKMHGALEKSLQALLEALRNPALASNIHTHSITLVSEELAATFVNYMGGGRACGILESDNTSAAEIVNHLYQSGEGAEYVKEIAWLYKTAFNVGVTGAMTWPSALVSELFDYTGMIISLYQAIAPIDCDPDIAVHYATCCFACLQGKMSGYSEMEPGEEKSELADRLMEYLVYVRMAIDNIEAAHANAEPFNTMIHTLVQHEAALLCDQSNWDRLNVMSERVLECAPLDSPADVVNYARWNRSLVLSLLHRGGEENGDKAFNLLTKAKAVVDAPGGADAYPDEEGEWLVSTAWGEGTEHLRYKRYAQGQRWCMLAISLCVSVPSAYQHCETLKGNYLQMLERAGFKPDIKLLGWA